MGEGITGFVGFDNYVNVLTSDQFWQSILVTVIYVLVAVPIELVLGFLAAWLVNLGAPGSRAFSTIIGAPLFTLEVAIGYLGVTFFTDQGGLIARAARRARHPCAVDVDRIRRDSRRHSFSTSGDGRRSSSSSFSRDWPEFRPTSTTLRSSTPKAIGR